MPPFVPISKRRKPTITYGRTSRSKFPSFKVFQDATARDEETDGIRKNQSEMISEVDTHLLSARNARDGFYCPSSGDADDLIISRLPPTQLQDQARMAAKSPARRRYRGGGKDRFGRPALTDKSTNNSILSKSTTTTQVAFGSAAGVTFPQLSKVDTPPYPKIDPKRKPALSPKDTPPLIVEVAYPTRPRKSRPAVSPLGHKDFATILLSSNVRKPGCKRYFRSHSEDLETGSDSLYYGPPGVLGVSAPRMNDSIGFRSGAWARDVLGGTNQETEKTVGVSLLVTGYGHQESKNELPELKNTLDLVVQKHQGQRMPKGRIMDYPDCSPINTSEIISSTRDVMSTGNFLEDPFSIPEGYKLDRGIRVGKDTGGSVRLDCAMDPTQDRCNMKESIQNRTEVGPPKIKQKHFAITRQPNTKFSLASATTDLNPGTACEFNNSESDNEMPSSSPIAKSTPKKDWYRFEDCDSVDTHNWGKNRQAQGEKPGPLKPVIFAWGSSDIYRLEGVTMRESPGGRPGSAGRVQRGCQEQNEMVDMFGRIKHPHRHSSYGSEIPEENRRGEGKSTIVTVNIIDLKEKKVNSKKRHKDLIYMDEYRTGKRLLREKKHKLTGSAVNLRNSGSKSVDSAGGYVREKEIYIRNSSLGYERTGMGDDIDELQMDLPGMRI